MTISYTAEVANASGFGCFTKILLKWGGSVYKLIYKELAAYLFLYFTINLIYRHWLCQPGMEEYRQFFESLKAYCALHINSIPMTFGLGFYVQLVVKRWWDQYNLLPWPDSLGLIVISLIHGIDEKSRLMRRNIMRYFLLSYVITLRRISLRVRKRFPTLDHVVEAGIMRADEKKYIESLDEKCSVSKWWLPLIWAGNIVKQARESNNIKSDPAVQTLLSELCQVRKGLTGVQHFDTISVPLVYTQVVTVAVYTYFGFALFGSQWVKPQDAKDFKAVYDLPAFEKNTDQRHPYQAFDLYLPFFLILQFIFYIGWLKVAETLINPFGEDDDDFELNYLIDRHVQVSYLIVDEKDEDRPKLEKDAFFDKPVPTELPYTEETAQYRREEPKGSAEVAEEIYNNSNIYYRMIMGGGSHGYGNNINTPTSGKHSRMGSRLIRRPQRTTMRKVSLSKPMGQSTFIGNGSSTNAVLNHGTNGSVLSHMNETVNSPPVGATAVQAQGNNNQHGQGISDWSGEESEYERIDPMTASSLNLFSWVKDRVRKSQMRSTHPNVHPSLSNLSNTEDSTSSTPGISVGPNYSNASRKTSRNKSQKFMKMFSNRKISKERLQRKESSNLQQQQQSLYVQNNKLYSIEGIDSSSTNQNNISTPDSLINNLTKAETLANKAPVNTNLDVESGILGRPQSVGLNKQFSPTASSPLPVTSAATSPQPQNTPDKLLSPPSSLIDENDLPGTSEEQRMMIIEKLRQLSPNYLSPITEVASPYNTNTNNSRRDSALPSVEAIFAITNPVMAASVTPTSPTSATSSSLTAVYSSITTPPTQQGPTYPSSYTMAGSTTTTSVLQQPQPQIPQHPLHHQQLKLNTSLDVESSNYYPLAGSEHSGPVASGPIPISVPLPISSSGSAEPRSQRFSVEEVPPYEPVMFRKPATVAEPPPMHGFVSEVHGNMHSLPAMTTQSDSTQQPLSMTAEVAVPEAYMSPALPKRQAVMSLKNVSSVEDNLASTTTSEPLNTTSTPVDILVTRASSPEKSDIKKGQEDNLTEPDSAFALQNTYYV